MKARSQTAAKEAVILLAFSLHQPREPGLGRDSEGYDLTSCYVRSEDGPLEVGEVSTTSVWEDVDGHVVASVVEEHFC